MGSLLALIASVKLHSPYFLTGSAELTFGRVRMAHLQAVGIGWASLATVAAALWLMCRLSRAELIYPKLLYLAAGLWNVGVFLAVAGILLGDAQSVEWLDAPPYAPPFFIAALGIVSAWTVAVFRRRREPHVYVTQWYILGAVFWFPWLYLVANFMIFWSPATGVVQPIVNWWFGHNVLGLWFTPVAVGAAYYLIPKIIGRPIHSYYLSIIGFWSLALFYSWAGMHHLIGGPIPGVAGERQHGRQHDDDHPRAGGGDQPPHDAARALPPAAVQPGAAVHRVRGDLVHPGQLPGVADGAEGRERDGPLHALHRRPRPPRRVRVRDDDLCSACSTT